MMKLFQKWEDVDHKAAWVMKVAVRDAQNAAVRNDMALQLYRRADYVQEKKFEPDIDEKIRTAELLHDIKSVLDGKQLTVFILAAYELNSTEIAKMTESTAATVRSQLRHARTKLSDALHLD